jgi:argininosuccinate lyase
MLSGLHFNREKLAQAAKTGFMTATDLADYLVKKNIPFRQAHAIVGQIVSSCLAQGLELDELPLAELQKHAPEIAADVADVLSVSGSVNSRQSPGGTALKQVSAALAEAEKALGI